MSKNPKSCPPSFMRGDVQAKRRTGGSPSVCTANRQNTHFSMKSRHPLRPGGSGLCPNPPGHLPHKWGRQDFFDTLRRALFARLCFYGNLCLFYLPKIVGFGRLCYNVFNRCKPDLHLLFSSVFGPPSPEPDQRPPSPRVVFFHAIRLPFFKPSNFYHRKDTTFWGNSRF